MTESQARMIVGSLPVRDEGLIYDFGMDLCQDTDFYLKKGFRVIAVDANPAVCEAASTRYASEIASRRLVVVNAAISEGTQPLVFYVCKTLSAWSTASPVLRDDKVKLGAVFEEIEVPSVRSGDLIERYGTPHFAKIDIEGFDLICLKGLLPAPVKPTFLSTEVDFYKLDEQLACLVELGYRKYALVGQTSAPRQKPPRPAREGADVDYTFAHHASGLFGRELPAEWSSWRGVRTQCRSIIGEYRWSGILRRLEALKSLRPLADRMRARYFPLALDWYDIHASF
ncbi:MAG TPA: FkbM family methyltransferase [Caulobacteraceae bacterium]|nr:FkbM family methyltransferase [Caulobacteraceae bacterium]